MLIYCYLPKLNLEIAHETVMWPNMAWTFDKVTFLMSNSEKPLGNLSEVAVSTLLINPPGPFWLICCAKLTLDLIDDLELYKRSHFRWIYVCVLVHFNLYYSIWQYKWHYEKNGIMKLLQHSNSYACF